MSVFGTGSTPSILERLRVLGTQYEAEAIVNEQEAVETTAETEAEVQQNRELWRSSQPYLPADATPIEERNYRASQARKIAKAKIRAANCRAQAACLRDRGMVLRDDYWDIQLAFTSHPDVVQATTMVPALVFRPSGPDRALAALTEQEQLT
jgi:hypothetical protein